MAIKFEKIKEGMTLYDVRKSHLMERWKWSIWPVFVKKIDTKRRRILASWNGNVSTWMTENKITKYRAKKPIQIRY